jgi:hypothetical protein
VTVNDAVELGGAVRRETAVAVWVGPKSRVKIPIQTDRAAIAALRRTRAFARRRTGMDITWLDGTGDARIDRIAVGGAIWNSSDRMKELKNVGVTHIINMQIECDDTEMAEEHGIEVSWNPTDDDFEVKPAELFAPGVKFALRALESGDAKVFIHCAAGVHRAPMMALAVLGAIGMKLEDAMELIEMKRPVADFAEVYVRSVERFLSGRHRG